MYLVILSIVILALVVYLAQRDLSYGVAMVLLLLPAYGIRWQVSGVSVTLLELSILVLAIAWIVRLAQRQTSFSTRNSFWCSGGALLVAATVSLFIAPQFAKGLETWLAYFIAPALFFVIFTATVKTEKQLVWTFRALGLTALAIGGLAVVQRFTNGWLVPDAYWLGGEGRRVTSFYSYANAVGLYLAPIVMLLVAWLYQRLQQSTSTVYQRLESGLIAVTIIISISAIIFAKSDGALVGLAAGLLFFGLSAKKTRVATAIIAAVGLITVAITGLPAGVWQTLTFADWSGQVRLTMWHETWALIKDHWLLGVGLFGYPTALVPYHAAKYLEIFWYPHNILFNFWVEIGLLGVAAVIGMFGQLVAKTWWYRQQILTVGILATFVVITVHGLVDAPYFKGDLAVLWWYLLAVSTIITSKTYVRVSTPTTR